MLMMMMMMMMMMKMIQEEEEDLTRGLFLWEQQTCVSCQESWSTLRMSRTTSVVVVGAGLVAGVASSPRPAHAL